jgi:hypothetical protein
MRCARRGCGKEVKGRSDKKTCSDSCRVMLSNQKNFRRIVKRNRRPLGERPLNARERKVVAAVHATLSRSASLYNEIFGGGAIVEHAAIAENVFQQITLSKLNSTSLYQSMLDFN